MITETSQAKAYVKHDKENALKCYEQARKLLPPKPKLNDIIRDLRQEIKGRPPLGRVQARAWDGPSAIGKKRLFQGSSRASEPNERRASDAADPEWNPSCSDAEDDTEELRHNQRKANKRKQPGASSAVDDLRVTSATPEQMETAENLFVAAQSQEQSNANAGRGRHRKTRNKALTNRLKQGVATLQEDSLRPKCSRNDRGKD